MNARLIAISSLILPQLAAANPVQAEYIHWQDGVLPSVDDALCTGFVTAHEWDDGGSVTDEEELRTAIAEAEGPTRIGIAADITLTEPIYLRSNIWLYGDGDRYRLQPKDLRAWETLYIADDIPQVDREKRSNIRITGLELQNIETAVGSIQAGNAGRPDGISFVDNHFTSLNSDRRKKPASTMLLFGRAGSSEMAERIDVCANIFLADWADTDTATSLSMAQVWRSTGIRFRGNAFLGRMKTALNINGSKNTNTYTEDPSSACTVANAFGECEINWELDQHSAQIEVFDNTIQRDPSPTGKPAGRNGESYEDHGIYVWGAEDVIIESNTIQGWTNTASGGCVKLASVRGAAVAGNACGSSILLYTHVYSYGFTDPTNDQVGGACLDAEATPHYWAPPLFQNVTIASNTLCTGSGPDRQVSSEDCGIGYTRYRISEEMPWPVNLQGEQDVRIHSNALNGGQISIFNSGSIGCSTGIHSLDTGLDPNGFTIQNNTDLGVNGCLFSSAIPAQNNSYLGGSPACL
jgi:hypothetical protein